MAQVKTLILALFLLSFLFPRSIVSGYVIDKNTGIAIQTANVFLSETTYGSTTHKDGYFSIRNIEPGKYTIVVSVVGYEKLINYIRIEKHEDLEFQFELIQKIIKMPEINVSAKDARRRKKNLSKFKRAFLGNTYNALETRILNSQVLEFASKTHSLTAKADSPLIIENKGLGYKILYTLEYFEYGHTFVKFSGNSSFSELIPRDETEASRWKKNRIKAYNGSLRHFITVISRQYLLEIEKYIIMNSTRVSEKGLAVMGDIKHNKHDLEGDFVIWFSESIENIKNGTPGKTIPMNKLITLGERNNEIVLKFKDYLVVKYAGERESLAYLRDFMETRIPGKQISWLNLARDSVILDIQGRYQDPLFQLHTGGYMAWERLGEMLPADYNPVN